MAEFVTVARLSDVPPGKMFTVQLDGKSVVLANVEGEIYAFDGTCTHADGPLGQGYLDGDVVECPFHGGAFNVKTGEAVALPCFEPIATYQVQIDGDDIKVVWPS